MIEGNAGVALSDERVATLQRRIRLLVLLHAAEQAGLVPMPILRLHAFAYLANVLAPVWDMPSLDGKVLKRHGGPFYPALQRDLDRLVGMGVVFVSRLGHVKESDGRWRLEGEYGLNRRPSDEVLTVLAGFPDERRFGAFIQELAYALSALSDEELDVAVSQDAAYSDPLVSIGNVLDFGEWRQVNYSARAARYFDAVIPGGSRRTRGEKLHLYARHMLQRLGVNA